jgi:hypothetical protein
MIHRSKNAALVSLERSISFSENRSLAYGVNSKLVRNLCCAVIVSPPVSALNVEVSTRRVLGKSGQMLANFPTSLADAKRSCSRVCKLRLVVFSLPMSFRVASRNVDLPLPPSPNSSIAF